MGCAKAAESSWPAQGSPRAVPHRQAFDLVHAAARKPPVPPTAVSTYYSNPPPGNRPLAGYPDRHGDSGAGRVRLRSVPVPPAVDAAGRLPPTETATPVARRVRLRA